MVCSAASPTLESLILLGFVTSLHSIAAAPPLFEPGFHSRVRAFVTEPMKCYQLALRNSFCTQNQFETREGSLTGDDGCVEPENRWLIA